MNLYDDSAFTLLQFSLLLIGTDGVGMIEAVTLSTISIYTGETVTLTTGSGDGSEIYTQTFTYSTSMAGKVHRAFINGMRINQPITDRHFWYLTLDSTSSLTSLNMRLATYHGNRFTWVGWVYLIYDDPLLNTGLPFIS